MSKRIIFILFVFVYFLGFKLVNAEVIINEVQIGGNCEFIELRADPSVSLTDFSIKRKTSSGTEYPLVASSKFEEKSFQGEYFLIANGENCPSVPDVIWPGSYSLSKDNSIILYKLSEKIDEIGWGNCNESCVTGNPDDNKSIQKDSSGSWIIASPTPKALNSDSESNENNNNEEENNDNDEGNENNNNTTTTTTGSSHSSVVKKKEAPKIIPVFKAKILAPTLAFVGQPIEFNLDIKYGDNTYAVGKYYWNFGDGVSMDKIEGFKKFTHTYFYPGEYNVYLEYFKNNGTFSPDITDEMTIKVVPLTVSISKVGDYKDFFIELTNNADYKIDISKWILASNNKFFTIPKNTGILGKKSIIIPGRVSGFVLGDENNLKLIMPTGEIVFDYSIKSAPIKKLVVSRETGTNMNTENEISNSDFNENKDSDQSESDLSAATVLSKANFGSNFIIIGFISLLGICAGAVYFLRRKRVSPKSIGDDFDILDE